MLEKLIEFIFPRKCGFCNILINEDYTCKKCKKNLEYICINNDLQIMNNKHFEFLISSYLYLGKVREKILEFKFKNKKYLYKSLSEELLTKLKQYSNEIDCVIVVPISINRYFERGYNQSMLIGKFISKKLNKPLHKFVLLKCKNNDKQSKLNLMERIANVEDVYKILNKKVILNKRILLIDDIYTTGATVNECSKVLKQNGAKNIIVATIARADIEKQLNCKA